MMGSVVAQATIVTIILARYQERERKGEKESGEKEEREGKEKNKNKKQQKGAPCDQTKGLPLVFFLKTL
jgi:hypothetical protein